MLKMSKGTEEVRKCKICGKTIVGKNKTGICSACKKKAGDTGVTVLGVLGLIASGVWTAVKAFTKKD
jgi:RecJ-like exonuclease